MHLLYKISVFIHILSAMFWFGGMIFTALVLVPTFRHHILKPYRGFFFAEMGRKFSGMSWLLFGILIVTGLFQLIARGYEWADLITSAFWNTNFGSNLRIKLIAFAAMLLISGIHDFWLGPKASQLIVEAPDLPRTQKYRKATSWVGRINLILGLIIIYFAVALVRG